MSALDHSDGDGSAERTPPLETVREGGRESTAVTSFHPRNSSGRPQRPTEYDTPFGLE
ncbi:hypothetical protein RBH26_18140 [Natronolimnohabitans sp. A-GB9]|uniref:hypothetical protein n=1 Tax=Natronolimnohabitans sp. A-GB9 TaxID=3069757 RepID=UPI0027B70AC1|nr:hypothetical protein [Natronolimnohabitans sp. A-GB9]MDQ2052391.1 hypothetical protein [Natronolimnohabitans sp. A-GB9]